MALALYLVVLAASCAYALRDWRRAWMLLPVLAVLQDPVRKLTPGTPVAISFSVMALYLAVLYSARRTLFAHLRELSARFPAVYTTASFIAVFLLLATLNGLATFGMSGWKAPILSLGLYVAPLPAVVLGYAFLQREETLYRFFGVYAAVTSVGLIGTILEYYRFKSPILGLVGYGWDYFRHLPGIQIRLLSGIYRAPDIMSWHAATLACIGLAMAMKNRSYRLLWIGAAGWGFLSCLLSGRRKSIYFIIAFAAVVVWRYFRRLQIKQLVALAAVALVIGVVVTRLSSDASSRAYTQGATASRAEILKRLEGGVMETFRQYGYLGAGLGMATQGAHYVSSGPQRRGWQEGGMAKLAVELGLPGLIAVAIFIATLFRLLLRLTAIGDVPGSSQLARVVLFGMFVANVVTFAAAAQAYTDGVLALMTAFLAGCLLATATLDERLAEQEQQRQQTPKQDGIQPVGSALPA